MTARRTRKRPTRRQAPPAPSRFVSYDLVVAYLMRGAIVIGLGVSGYFLDRVYQATSTVPVLSERIDGLKEEIAGIKDGMKALWGRVNNDSHH